MRTLPVVECYRAAQYFNVLSDFDKKLSKVIYDVFGENTDYSDVVRNVSVALDQIHLPYFVTRFDYWYKKNNNSRYEEYFRTIEGLWNPEVKKTPDFILQMAVAICNSTLCNVEMGVKRLCGDNKIIIEEFGIDFASDKMSICILDGDRHEGGMQPLMFMSGEKKLIYKPRSSRTESVINRICNSIGFYDICPKTIDRGNYCWQEFITNNSVSDISDFHEVYENYGVILAIASALNLNDCHFDNFIVDGKCVRLIDSETCFQFYGLDIEVSILQTGLLQSKNHILDGMGHTSAITATDGVFTSFCYPYAINDKTNKIQVKYEKAYMDKKKNYPYLKEIKPKVSNYTSDVQIGFEKGYLNLIGNKDEIISIINDCRGGKVKIPCASNCILSVCDK